MRINDSPSSSSPSMSAGRRRVGTAALRGVACLLLFVLAFALRREGVDWANLHPDSTKMTRWMQWTLHHPYVRDQVYAGGFFTLFRPVQNLTVWRELRRANADPVRRDAAPVVRDRVERDLDVILLARKFNAGLGALTCVTLLFLAWSITGSFAAGCFAGFLAAVNPWHIEHCHYAETDVAMVFTLSVALLLWARVERSSGRWWFAAASLASGFAAGTKYPLVLLVVLVVAFALRKRDGAHRRGARAWWVVLGLASFLVGFAWANPAVLFAPQWFFTGLFREGAGVASETAGVLGEAYGKPFARSMHQARWAARFVLAHGLAWLATTLAGTGVLLTGRFRTRWRVTLLFPALYALYLIGLGPWIRMQEILGFMPFACCAAAAVAVAALRWSGTASVHRGWKRAAVTILGLAVCTSLLVQGIRRSNLATRIDTRHDAEEWLQSHLPRGAIVGAEIYTKTRPGHPVPVRELVHLSKVEWEGVTPARALGCTYLLRNVTLTGRGAIDPFTGDLYERLERNRQAFLASSEWLAAWTPIDPEDEVTFAFFNPALRLYGLRRWNETVFVEAPITAPVRLREGGAAAAYPVGRRFGSEAGVVVDRTAHSLRVGGPAIPDDGVYLVLRGLGRRARVQVRGFGRRIEHPVAARGAVVLHLKRSHLMPALQRFEKIRLRADVDEACLAEVVFDRWRAAAILLESGSPGDALRLLEGRAKESANDGAVRTLARIDAGGGSDDAAPRQQLAQVEAALAAAPEDVRINGVSGYYYNQFARVYLGARDKVYTAPLRQAVLLPAGAWHIRVDTRTAGRPEWRTVDRDIVIEAPVLFDFELAGLREEGGFEYRNAEIYWTLRDRLRDLERRLRRGLD